ncbi:uncharacterized protein LOC142530705 [Primulina tabacum]|uniref:uncharacterized protein LOC142530705 n=1 Tax=Primulina tabacum TaxID=48773 RepID=UPI003F5A4A73
MSCCIFCVARRFSYEPPSFCCDSGKIRLALPVAPTILIDLFKDVSTPSALLFRRKIRLYNSLFAFTSFVARLDKNLASSNHGVYTFRVSGQVFHSLPPLVPLKDRPKYFQLYFWDSDNELHNRMSVVDDSDVDEGIMLLLMDLLKVNPYAQLLKRINQYPMSRGLRLHICKNVLVDQRCYNSPSADQVAAIWLEGSDIVNIPYDRDIFVHGNDGLMHQTMHYFGCYDPLQYPLFFPYGDSGWHQHIPKISNDLASGDVVIDVMPNSNVSSFSEVVPYFTSAVHGKNDGMVSCREYYCYKLQIRDTDMSVLLYGGRLLQQFVVDMYIKLETTRLDYHRRNQSEIRAEMYQGIVDSVVNGETRGSEIGHRVVLPASFIGGPRDMRKRYLDAIALVRALGKPDLFITMTCNPECKEIKDNLFVGQVAQDRPDLVSRLLQKPTKYIITTTIEDGYETGKITLFGKVATYFVGCSVEDFIQIHNQNLPNNPYKNLLNQPSSKLYTFLFKLDNSVEKRDGVLKIVAEANEIHDKYPTTNVNQETKISEDYQVN